MARRIFGARFGTKKKRRGTANWKVTQWRKSPDCHYCGLRLRNPSEATVDHVVPLAKGGYSKRSNYVLACRNCNNAKGAKDYAEFVHGKR